MHDWEFPMQIRHRTPTIFSIYMVDVLCCALGCVVLMWQYNLNEAEEEANAKQEALKNLAQSNVSLESTEKLLAEQKRLHASDLKALQDRLSQVIDALANDKT